MDLLSSCPTVAASHLSSLLFLGVKPTTITPADNIAVGAGVNSEDGSTEVQRKLESLEQAADHERRFGPPGWNALSRGRGDSSSKIKGDLLSWKGDPKLLYTILRWIPTARRLGRHIWRPSHASHAACAVRTCCSARMVLISSSVQKVP